MTLNQRWVCECCYLHLGTMDDSTCEYYYGHDEQDHPAGLMGMFTYLDTVPGDEQLEIPMGSFRECDGCRGVVKAMGTLHEVIYFVG